MLPPKNKKVNLLVSYAYMKDLSDELTSWIYNVPEVNWLLDCGAFTAFTLGKEININEYIEYCKKWSSKLYGYFALDSIRNPKQTALNLDIMLQKDTQPVPVHVRGDNEQRMNDLYTISDYIGLGGMKRGHGGGYNISYVDQKMQWAKGRKVHWFGQANQLLLNTYKPFSCDASTASRGRRWGLLKIYRDPFTPVLEFTYKEFIQSKIPLWCREVIEQLGFTYEDILLEENWHGVRQMASMVGRSSFIRYMWDCEKYLGTKYFIADSIAGMYELFYIHGKINNIEYCNPELIPDKLM